MTEDRLETRVRALAKVRRRDARALQLALDYLESDPPGSLTKTRMILEGVVLEMHELEMGGPPRKPLLGEMLANNQFARLIERRMLSRMHAVRDMANLGTHGEKVDATDGRRALENLCDILDWFIERYGASPEVGRTTTMAPPAPAKKARRSAAALIGVVSAVLGFVAVIAVVSWQGWMGPAGVPGGESSGLTSALPGQPISSSSSVLVPAAEPPRPTEPRSGAAFSPRSRAHMLRWQPQPGHEGAMHEVQIERVSPEAHVFPTKTAPDGQPYVVIDWSALADKPGKYRWRVRERGGPVWSTWQSFSLYPSQLARIQSEQLLRFGIEKVQHPPFVSWNTDQARYVGFDVELAERIGKELGAKMELVGRPWEELLSSPLPLEFDAVISAVTITPERCTRYAFSEPYLVTGQRLAKTTSKPTGFDDLFVLGVQRNTTSERIARAKFKAADIRIIDTNDLVMAAMMEGRVEAIVMDEVLMTTRPEARAEAGSGWTLDGPLLSTEGYGIMLPRDEPELVEKVNGVLATLRQSGWLGELMDKHGIREAPRQEGLGCPK